MDCCLSCNRGVELLSNEFDAVKSRICSMLFKICSHKIPQCHLKLSSQRITSMIDWASHGITLKSFNLIDQITEYLLNIHLKGADQIVIVECKVWD